MITIGFILYKNNTFTSNNQPEDTSVVVREYLEMMIPHHEEAVKVSTPIMNDLSITEPKVRILAANIVDNQSFEMVQMRNLYIEFLGGYYTATTTYHTITKDLSVLKGDELAKVYLNEMIKHHKEAIKVSQKYMKKIEKVRKASSYTENGLTVMNTHPSLDITYDIAKKLIEDQEKEIELIKSLY